MRQNFDLKKKIKFVSSQFLFIFSSLVLAQSFLPLSFGELVTEKASAEPNILQIRAEHPKIIQL